MFTWIPIYEELATKIIEFENKQHELIAMLKEMAIEDIYSIQLQDYGPGDKPIELSEIDPFTFFANFNRNLTIDNRIAILAYLKGKLRLNSPLPSDFDGIPVADSRNVWFFAYAKHRTPADVPALWKIAVQAVSRPPEKLDAKTFEACIGGRIQQVGTAKLTMGLFWFRPREYLALDGKMRSHLEAKGVSVPEIKSLADYLSAVKAARALCDGDFVKLSRAAYIAEKTPPPAKSYWSGGIVWDGDRKEDKFISGNYWQHGYKTRDERGAHIWNLFDQIKVGDEFAMKGFGGRNDLKIYYVGEVTAVEPEKAMVRLRKLDRPLYHDKAPANGGKGTWFDTILEVASPDAIKKVFGLEQSASSLGAPFNAIFKDRAEAEWFFGELEECMSTLGVESPDDERIALTLPYGKKELHLNYGQWLVLGCHGSDQPDTRFLVVLPRKYAESLNLQRNGEGPFMHKNNTDDLSLYFVRDSDSAKLKGDIGKKYHEALKAVPSIMQNWSKSPYRRSHQNELARMVFDQNERQKLLTSGLKSSGLNGDPDNVVVPLALGGNDALNRIIYGPPGTGKTFGTIREAVGIIQGSTDGDDQEIKRRFDQLCAQGRIAFVTFHQSYSYEDFVEGIRPVLDDGDGNVAYECRNGIFKKMALRALYGCLESQHKDATAEYEVRWTALLGKVESEPERAYEGIGGRSKYRLSVTEKGNVVATNTADNDIRLNFSNSNLLKVFLKHRRESSVTTAQVSSAVGVGCHCTLGAILFRELQREEVSAESALPAQLESEEKREEIALQFVADSQSSPYQLRSGSEPERFVLIIDEINRGNISKVFGELITLIEDDKRVGGKWTLIAKLPYSQRSFAIPSNLYIIGTMNTADKSIALVDVALRRRFTFKELMPDYGKIADDNVRAVLQELNRRITLRKDRDHQIGHSYFMNSADANAVIRQKIFPLLQEYFYNDWEGLRFVLGEVEDNKSTFVLKLPANNESKWLRNKWAWFFDLNTDVKDCLAALRTNYFAAPPLSSNA